MLLSVERSPRAVRAAGGLTERRVEAPMPRVYTSLPIAERLAKYTNVNGPILREDLGPCHVWTGCLSEGYGVLTIGPKKSRKHVRAHVLAFFVAHGRWPDPQALHHCDNRPCVKAADDELGPAHIFEGTQLDNMQDMVAKGRHGSHVRPELRQGERNPRAKLTVEGVVIIRSSPNESLASLAHRLGVSEATVTDVRGGRTWRGVLGKPE